MSWFEQLRPRSRRIPGRYTDSRMNIFVLDKDIETNAQYHCDKHCYKMCIEYHQIWCAALYLHGAYADGMYRPTHVHHPSVKWAAASTGNFVWLTTLRDALHREYNCRQSKIHATSRNAKQFPLEEFIHKIPSGPLTVPPLCMPPECKIDNSGTWEASVRCYRFYYTEHKKRFASWKHSEAPEWFTVST